MATSRPWSEDTTASILDASFTSSHTVTMKWRTRTTGEKSYPNPVASQPQLVTDPTGASHAMYGVFSDVVNLTFDGNNSNTPVQTDPYVLQISVLDAAFNGDHAALTNAAMLGFLYLGWMDTTASPDGTNEKWQHATEGNIGGINYGTSNKKGYLGSYANYVSEHPGTPLANLGAWGVEITGGGANVWAVVNHNSIFAAVPEPSAFVLAGLGFVGLAGVVCRRRKLKAA